MNDHLKNHPDLGIHSEVGEQSATLILSGQFLAGSAQRVFENVDRLTLKEGQELVLEMDQVHYLDSGALGCLLALHSRLGSRNVAIRLSKSSSQVESLLRRINCWQLFRHQDMPTAPKDHLKAYTSLGEILSHKVNLLTILLATTGEIAGALEEDYLCQKIVQELTSLIGEDRVLLYLGLDDSEDLSLYTSEGKQSEKQKGGVPTTLPRSAFEALKTIPSTGIYTQILTDLEQLVAPLSRYLREDGAEAVAVSPLVGMRGELGWLVLGLNADTRLLAEDNLRGLDLFLKVSGLLLDNIRSEQERRLEAEQVQQALGDLSQSSEDEDLYKKACSLEKFLVRLTRRLNNQLVPVLGYTQMLLKTGQMAPIDRGRLERIEESIQSAKRLVNGLIGLTTPPALAPSQENLNDICQRAVSQLQREEPEFGAIEIIWDLEENLPLARVDARQCELVFHQVLRNAWEAIMEHGGGRIHILSRTEEEGVTFEIEDNGVGMPESTIKRVFEPFFSMREHTSHLGLGLSLCKSILDLHKGRIELKSWPKSGTQVYLQWPVGQESQVSPVASCQPKEERFVRRSRIVVVDDERVCADLIMDVLNEEHEVMVFYEARQAMQYLERHPYDLILSDLRMPEISGEDLYHWIAEQLPGREKDLVFVTGNAFEPAYRSFIESIDNIVIAKPFNLGTFRSLVRLALERVGLEQ